jgi:hypothetical protein
LASWALLALALALGFDVFRLVDRPDPDLRAEPLARAPVFFGAFELLRAAFRGLLRLAFFFLRADIEG